MLSQRSESTFKTRTEARLGHALRLEWLGQTTASLCWIASVLTYGISSSGDWLQLAAASAWLLANLAELAKAGTQQESAS